MQSALSPLGTGITTEGATPTAREETVLLVVVGAHLEGQPLNHQLTGRGARLIDRTMTAPQYRLFALGTEPPKPGLLRVSPRDRGASSIEVEVWELDVAAFGEFVNEVPAPLGIGRVRLADGSEQGGFICEPIALDGALEITQFGGWRGYLESRVSPGPD